MKVGLDLEKGSLTITDDLISQVGDLGGAWRAIEQEISDREAALFATRGFGQWAALDRATANRKGNSRVLVESGHLLDSLTSIGRGYGTAAVSRDTLTITATQPYAAWLRDGAGGRPKRDPLPPLTSSEAETMGELLMDYLLAATR